jgi:predicted GH43/DUF377 family glycosyl hydrolase
MLKFIKIHFNRLKQTPFNNTYNLNSIRILKNFIGNYTYNACICSIELGYRIFYRSVSIKYGDDKIRTCILDLNYNVIPNTDKALDLYSNCYHRQARYKLGEHVEDPRVIMHKNNWFVCYTDGYVVGVAKLDLECNTIYSQFLHKPSEIKFKGGDGREKNWLPISMGEEIHFWYGDEPRTFLVYEDVDTELKYKSFFRTNQSVVTKYGKIRGGCSPIKYNDKQQIWFFHTLFENKYRIGAYLTEGTQIIAITSQPIITGDRIVFPCGAVQNENGWTISMGINDMSIGILHVSKDIVFTPINFLKRILSSVMTNSELN